MTFVEGRLLDDYLVDRKLQLAVERLPEIIGEALNSAIRSDADLVDSITELRRFIALRNRIIHAYDSIDGEIFWNIVDLYVPRLMPEIVQFLSQPDDLSHGC